MKRESKEFERELTVFGNEVELAAQTLYAHLTIHNVAGKSGKIRRTLNRHAKFWNTTLYALQCSGFLILGRIFDQNSKHNVDRILRVAQKHSVIFSKAELAERKRKNAPFADEWLPEYLKNAYEPNPADFRRLRKEVKKWRDQYKGYGDVRRRIFAHTEITDPVEVSEMFESLKVRQLQELVVFLNRLHRALWELYHNGRKPVLRRMPYSAKRMARNSLTQQSLRTVQQVVVKDTKDILTELAKSEIAQPGPGAYIQPASRFLRGKNRAPGRLSAQG